MFNLHPYATDSDERDKIVPVVGALAVVTVWVLHVLLDHLNVQVAWWADAPTPIALYFVIRKWLDASLWRWSLLRRLGVVKIPYFGGQWTGTLKSTATNGDELPCHVTIRQTWTTIGIVLETETSRSTNLVAGILVHTVYDAELQYEYLNEPKSGAPEGMEKHRGSVALNLTHHAGHAVLSGDYFTGRGRLSYGAVRLRRSDGSA